MGALIVTAIAAMSACTAEVPTVDQQQMAAVCPPGQVCANGGVVATCPPGQVCATGPTVCPPGQVCPGIVPAGYCRLDTRQVVEAHGHIIEIVTSRGQLFEFENGISVQPATASYLPVPYTPIVAAPGGPPVVAPGVAAPPAALGLGSELTSVPLYAAGPCLGAPPGQCHFETHAFVLLPEGRLLEYVTLAGRQWVFEAGQMTGAGVDLAAIPRYAAICSLRGLSGGLCHFDTRTFFKDGDDVIESITAYGRRWQLDIDGIPDPDSGIDLTQIPQYAVGPCRGRGPGECMFETRTFELFNGQPTESITAQGAIFRYAITGHDMPGNGLPIASVPYLANGPCR